MMNSGIVTGAERRAAKRTGDVSAMTRAEATREVASAETVDRCRSIFSEHKSNRVKRSAYVRALAIGSELSKPVFIAPASAELSGMSAVDLLSDKDAEFTKLVEKFTAMGKPDPVKSARASIAAQAQAAKKRAAKMAEA